MDDSLSLNLHQQAIQAALSCQWEEALKLNEQIIEQDPGNIDALNRQAHAYFELGNLIQAKKYYSDVLKFDAYNPIAAKNLKIIQVFKNGVKPSSNGHQKSHAVSPSLFLQEPGRTKVVSLLKVAEPQKLSLAFCGELVELMVKNRGVTVCDCEGGYLGVLPDDLAHQIIRLIKGGNKYETYIKSIKVNGLAILIKETFRSKKFKNQPSFLESAGVLPPMEVVSALNSKEIVEDEVPPLEEDES